MDDSKAVTLCIALCIVLPLLDVALLMMDVVSLTWFLILLVVLEIASFLPLLTLKGPVIEFLDDSLRVKGPFVDVAVPYSGIDSVRLVRDFKFGIRIMGYGGIRRGSGTFSNKSLGSYTLAAVNASHRTVIVVRYDKGPLAFNLGTQEETERAYERLRDIMGGDAPTSVGPTETSETSHRRNTRVVVGLVSVSLVAVLLIVVFALNSGHVDVSLDGGRLSVDAVMVDEDIALEDITGIELREDVDYGSRVGGLSSSGYLSGSFSNDEFGRYTLAVHKGVDLCIVVHATGGTVVFNLATAEDTLAFFEDLEDRLAGTASDSANTLYAATPMPCA